ncbi:zinc ribbon domain-containing protein [Pyrobaculum arsenaticum]|uniref:Uncharacterized protein n=2 Tax=Pyrobaculum arsenaticum TaxID=121277 RepID=A4WJQ6_PYRAR|nr:conserved hypothetical protein [Pyrobaculum arsenaticum DSM 13514]NYR14445.1 zinc ribbon domain-containing protein [Pyrobaculum arsenaticum]
MFIFINTASYTCVRCSYCGAPLDVTPESVVVVCKYCGTPNFLTGNPSKILAVPTLTSSEILRRAVERTKRDFNLGRRMSDINFSSPELLYVPFYFVDVAIRAVYDAVVTVTYTKTVRVAGRTEMRTVSKTVRVSGSVRLQDVVAVLARRAAWGISVDKLTEHFFKTAPEPKTLSEVVSSASVSSSFLAGEMTPERAKAKAVRAVMPRLLELVDEDASEKAKLAVGVLVASTFVQDKAVDYTVERLKASPLTYLPMWVVPYLFKGSYYSYYVAGWDGAVIVAEEPTFAEHKALYLAGTSLLGGVLGGIGATLLIDPVVASAFVIGAGVLTYLASSPMLRPRRVEK